MNVDALISSLERFSSQLETTLAGVTTEEARWKPGTTFWSMLEIVRHLGDEEVDDFRKRIELTLDDPGAPWPGIDPESWAKERRYNEDDFDEALGRFLEERRKSITWLRSLDEPDWSATHMHTLMGEIRTGDLLAAWATHDLLHHRQIVKRRYQLLVEAAGDFQTGYAGEWGP